MKKYLLLLPLLFMLTYCSKTDVPSVHGKWYGAEGDVESQYILYRVNRGKHNGRKDTTIVPPPDTTGTDTTTTTQPPPPALPMAYSIDMAAPLQQGGEGSCVAFSCVYAREREHYNQTGQWVRLSQEFLFDQNTNDHTTCSGSAIVTTLSFMIGHGVCTSASMPYSWTNGCNVIPTAAQNQEALAFRINDFIQYWITDAQNIKQALVQNHPLIIQVAADQQFSNAGPGFVWTTLGPVIGYHSLVICGYDDIRRAYRVENSWGTAWGDSGYGWISYDLMPLASSSALKILL